MNMRSYISDMCEDAMFLAEEKFDSAIIGLAERFGGVEAVAYDVQKVLEILEEEFSSMDDAIEWYEYNILGAWMGERTPIFVTLPKGGNDE